MTVSSILWAIVGLIICTFIVTGITLLIIGLLWWMIRKDLDFEDLTYYDDMEDPDNE